MTNMETRFNEQFGHWNIPLPPDDIANRRRGKIIHAGWVIYYLFGADPQKGEYLDYFAAHRMTNDRHVRIYENGATEGLPTLEWYRLSSKDPEEEKRLEAEYMATNQAIGKMLDEKWGWCHGDN